MSENPHVPVAGELRVTVPLPGVVVDETLERGRYVVRPGLELVKLDMSESHRLSETVYNIVTNVRLEFFGVIDHLDEQTSVAAGEVVDRALALLTVVKPPLFAGTFAVVDRYSGTEWIREGTAGDGSARPDFLGLRQISGEHLGAWKALLDHWPVEPNRPLELALRYYLESVLDLQNGQTARSIVSAAVATEVLFGDSRTELTYRISLRGSHLLTRGVPGIDVRKRLADLYALRSGVVHSGRGGTATQCQLWHAFLRAAIPYVAAYDGNLDELRRDLDQANFARSSKLDHLLNADPAWWRVCDFVNYVDPDPDHDVQSD